MLPIYIGIIINHYKDHTVIFQFPIYLEPGVESRYLNKNFGSLAWECDRFVETNTGGVGLEDEGYTDTLPKTNSKNAPQKMDGWKTIHPFPFG